MSGTGGTSEYACQAPPGVKCDSVSGTYANAAQGNLPSQRQSLRSGTKEGGAMTPISRRATNADPQSGFPEVSSGEGIDIAASGRPLRSQPRVLRLWIKPYEDADSDLMGEQRVYVRVDDGRWLVDHYQRSIREAYAPIKPPAQLSRQTKDEANGANYGNESQPSPVDSQSLTQRLKAAGFGGLGYPQAPASVGGPK